MSEIILKPKLQPEVPIELDSIIPDNLAGKSIDEIKKMEIWFGNEKAPLSEFFDVEGESSENASEIKIVFDGDVGNSKRIGQGMTAGEILLLVVSFLIPLIATIPFYGLELLVGFLQAMIFAGLTLVFGVIAMSSHAEEESEHTTT